MFTRGRGPHARGRRYGIDDSRVGSWVLKLLDVYEGTYKAFGGAFPLNRLLQANGMESKTGTGREAIELARAGRWPELGEYCMQVLLQHQIRCCEYCCNTKLGSIVGRL